MVKFDWIKKLHNSDQATKFEIRGYLNLSLKKQQRLSAVIERNRN